MSICRTDSKGGLNIISMKDDRLTAFLRKTLIICHVKSKLTGINLSVLNYCSNFATLFGVTADNGRVAGHVALGDKQI